MASSQSLRATCARCIAPACSMGRLGHGPFRFRYMDFSPTDANARGDQSHSVIMKFASSVQVLARIFHKPTARRGATLINTPLKPNPCSWARPFPSPLPSPGAGTIQRERRFSKVPANPQCIRTIKIKSKITIKIIPEPALFSERAALWKIRFGSVFMALLSPLSPVQLHRSGLGRGPGGRGEGHLDQPDDYFHTRQVESSQPSFHR